LTYSSSPKRGLTEQLQHQAFQVLAADRLNLDKHLLIQEQSSIGWHHLLCRCFSQQCSILHAQHILPSGPAPTTLEQIASLWQKKLIGFLWTHLTQHGLNTMLTNMATIASRPTPLSNERFRMSLPVITLHGEPVTHLLSCSTIHQSGCGARISNPSYPAVSVPHPMTRHSYPLLENHEKAHTKIALFPLISIPTLVIDYHISTPPDWDTLFEACYPLQGVWCLDLMAGSKLLVHYMI